jgi:hypothetical protein
MEEQQSLENAGREIGCHRNARSTIHAQRRDRQQGRDLNNGASEIRTQDQSVKSPVAAIKTPCTTGVSGLLEQIKEQMVAY